MSAQRIFQGVALLLCAIVALAGCATSDVRPSIEIGAAYVPNPPNWSVSTDLKSATRTQWSFGASLKTTFDESGPILEPCAAAGLTVNSTWTIEGEQLLGTSSFGFPAEFCVTVEPRE